MLIIWDIKNEYKNKEYLMNIDKNIKWEVSG